MLKKTEKLSLLTPHHDAVDSEDAKCCACCPLLIVVADHFYIALFSALDQVDSLHLHVILHE